MAKRTNSSDRPRSLDKVSQDELDLLIEEKQKELEYLEARSRRLNASRGDSAPRKRSNASGQAAARSSSGERKRRSGSGESGRSTALTEGRRRPTSDAPAKRAKSAQRETDRSTAAAGARKRPESDRRVKAAAKVWEQNSYDEDFVYNEETENEEKPFFSERLIKVVGGIIGIIIVLLVVFVVFGKKVKKTVVSDTREKVELASSDNVINILLVGQDGRDDVEGSRSDSMMICSVNKSSGKVKIISLMRDMYVQIPGYDDNRINASYSYGGVKLLKKTIEQDFQIQIDGNVQVDFESFKSIIDNLGGITINLSQEEADYLNYAYWQNEWNLTAGPNVLTGDQALAYARTRQVGNSDFERTERQRTVLMTIFRETKAKGPLAMLNMVRTIYPKLETDIGIGDMVSLATAAAGLDESDITTYRLPKDGTYTAETIRQMAVLVPDMDANRAYLKELIYN